MGSKTWSVNKGVSVTKTAAAAWAKEANIAAKKRGSTTRYRWRAIKSFPYGFQRFAVHQKKK